MHPPDDDYALERDVIRRIALGDRAAFEAFYHAYERRVRRFATRMLADESLSEEVTSDVMVEVWRSAARYSGRSKPSTWVLGIAYHKAADHLRRKRPALVDLRLAETLSGDDDGPARNAIAAATRADIDAALAALTPEHRIVLHLALVLGYPQADIAAIVDCPLGTVKTRLFHAKRALRRTLSPRFEREIS